MYERFAERSEILKIKAQNRVVTRYVGSGITALGSGISDHGIGISRSGCTIFVGSGTKSGDAFGTKDQKFEYTKSKLK